MKRLRSSHELRKILRTVCVRAVNCDRRMYSCFYPKKIGRGLKVLCNKTLKDSTKSPLGLGMPFFCSVFLFVYLFCSCCYFKAFVFVYFRTWCMWAPISPHPATSGLSRNTFFPAAKYIQKSNGGRSTGELSATKKDNEASLGENGPKKIEKVCLKRTTWNFFSRHPGLTMDTSEGAFSKFTLVHHSTTSLALVDTEQVSTPSRGREICFDPLSRTRHWETI